MALFAVAVIVLFAVFAVVSALYYGLILTVLLKVLEHFVMALMLGLLLV